MLSGPKKTVAVQMPMALYESLSGLAKEDGRTIPAEIRQILKGYLDYLGRGGVSWCADSRNRGIEQYTET